MADAVDLFDKLVRSSKKSAVEAARYQQEVAGLREALGIQKENIEFLEGTVVTGQETQAQLTQAVQRNVLKSLSNFQIQQKTLLENLEQSQSTNKALLIGAIALGAIGIMR